MSEVQTNENANQEPAVQLTAEELKAKKIADLQTKIAKLQQRLDDVINDRQPQAKAKKEVYEPAPGDVVLATVGRNTATSQAQVKEGVVVAVKHADIDPATGKAKGATQVRVRIGEGFDEQLVTLYPAQLQLKVEDTAAPTEEAPEVVVGG